MLYRFKSQASADIVMLESDARQLLDIIGKAAGGAGVITVDQQPAAIAALEAAIGREAQLAPHHNDAHAMEDHDADAEAQHVALRQRATPLLRMLRESQSERRDIVWST